MNSILQAINISRYDRDIPIIQNASFELFPGEVTCLVGENGAGKSMLVKMLAGHEPISQGSLIIKNQKMHPYNTNTAHKMGVYLSAQERNLFENLSVLDNLCLNSPLEKMFLFNKKKLYLYCQQLLDRVHLNVDLDTMVCDLHVREQKLIELARFFHYNADILLLDEPTAPLFEPDIELLYKIIEEERARGKCIVLVSHDIADVNRISNRVIVMRNGKICENQINDEKLNHNAILSSIKGKLYLNRYPKTKTEQGDEFLRVESLSDRGGTISDVSFTIRKGEIVGIAGIEGAGKTNLTKLLFGVREKQRGTFYIDGKETAINSASDAIRHGFAYIGNYAPDYLFLQQNVNYNLSAFKWNKRLRFTSDHRLKNESCELIGRFKINVSSVSLLTSHVSMGNQQKISLARWFTKKNRLFIMDDPTKSLDISSKIDFYNILDRLTKNGYSFILASSDLNELICMCDRILIMREGRIAHNIIVKNTNPHAIVDMTIPNWNSTLA